jgi:serine/threonine protein kinase
MDPKSDDRQVKVEGSLGSSSHARSTNFTKRDSTIAPRPGEAAESSALPAIPGYTILATLGQGGMGHVYKAMQERLDRIVALKVIRQDRQDTEAIRRFRKEAKAAAKLSHPNIVVVHDFDQVGDNCFIAMEYVEGTDLYQLVKDHGPLPVPQACDYIRQVAMGLQHAHERSLVHRDIKPANLLVAGIQPGQPLKENTLEGTVKILDMGMALLHGGEKDSVHGGIPSAGIMGTPDYMAPEQALDFQKVDIRADLYSLGCTFYFLLTGRPPFDEYPLMRKMMMHQSGTIRPVWEVRSAIPEKIDAIVQKLLAKKTQDRFQTPAELAEVLTAIVSAPATEPLERRKYESKIDSEKPASKQEERPSKRRTVRPEPAQVGRSRETPGSVGSSPPPVAKNPPSSVAPVSSREDKEPDESAKENVDAAPGPRPPKKMVQFQGPANGASALAFGPKRDILGAGGLQGALRLWDLDSPPRERIVLQTFETEVYSLAFSPDQRTLAWGSGVLNGLVCLADLTDPTLNQMTLLHRHKAQVDALTYSPDGKMLATGSRDLTVCWWDLTQPEPKELSVFKGHKGDITGVAFSPDNKTLASASQDGTVRLWKNGGFWSKGKAVIDGNWGSVRTVAFAHLAPVLAFGCQDQTVRLFALDGSSHQEAAVLRGHAGAVRLVMFPLEGKSLISICEKGTAILWDLASGAESYRWSLGELVAPGSGSGSFGLAMTPDGRYAAIGSPEGGITLWRLFSKKSK